MKTKITTDWHIAAKRVGGTTPDSQQALRQHLRNALQAQLDDNDHLIAGDLFNEFTVETSELIETYKIFCSWLTRYGKKLALVRGNHDFSLRGSAQSSFDLLGHILKEQFPKQVTIANEVTEWKQFILVPHLPNNEILNMEVSKLSNVSGKVVVFHANVDNFFAAETQHSLNLTMEQVEDLVSRDNLIICGHEHQHRKLVNGRCVILGNTTPSSIADCLGNSVKYSAMISGTDYELDQTWEAFNSYTEIDWRELAAGTAAPDDHQFIRITGDATALESAEVIRVVSALRQRHHAFVITNSVKVEGQDMVSDMADQTVEDIKAFDVLNAIFSELEPDEIACVKGLLNAE